jgi:hypothetical protein
MRYRQKYIPEITSEWNTKTSKDLRKSVSKWYRKNLAGKIITNKCLSIPINFSVTGGKKLAMGGAIYLHKAELVRILPDILEHATYNNWGDKKLKDSAIVIGYLNFKCKVRIDNIEKHVRIAVRMQKDGRLYWNHEVNISK